LPSAIGSVSVCKLIGETTYDLKLMEKNNVIICTATIWDILSRRWKKRKPIQQISLYIVDEIHLIGGLDGPNLEIVLSRARHMSSQIDKRIRIVALGASVANAKDLGEWLGVPHQLCFNFTPHVRPTPLELNVHSFEAYHHGSRLLAMAKPVFHAVVGNWASKPVLIFVPSSKQAQLTAIDMITFAPSTGNPNIFLNAPLESLEVILSRVRDSALSQTLSRGVGFIHSALHSNDRDIVEALYKDNVISVIVCAFDYCWKFQVCAHHVVVMDTVYFEGKEHRFVDYSITDVIQMMGLAGRPLLDDSGVCTILCQTPKKDFLSKILREPLPIESHLHQLLHDLLNSEIVEKGIENKQDAVDYLTWTFFYRRLFHNPNYYGLKGSSHRHLSDHLSELIERVINDLEESKCVSVEDEMDLSPLNLGMIASYYCIQYTTVEIFASSIGPKTKVKGLVEILSASSEFTNLSIRQNEDTVLKKLAAHLPQALPENAHFDESSTKVLVLLQCHFSRSPLGTDLFNDLKFVIKDCMKLTQALVDVVSSQGWLRPALACMELSQMIVQGQWGKNSVLFQIPHFDDAIVSRCMKFDPPVESVYDFLELDDGMRSSLLSFSQEKLSDVALFCNSYPNIELSFEKDFGDVVESGSSLSVLVALQRDVDNEEELSGIGKVVSSRFPHDKQEGWWLLLGDPSNGLIFSVKRITIDLKNKVIYYFIIIF
jgi:pre-mRNA-splicing helicase BRR2